MKCQVALSIIINNFNYHQYLPQCVESILAQTDTDFEIVVVDDGSTDGSWDYIQSLPTNIIKLASPHLNQAGACFLAAKAARGAFLHFLDADDFVQPDFVASIRPFLTTDVSKIQVQLIPVNSEGSPTGAAFPHFDQDAANSNLKNEIFKNGQYTSPQTSGNIFARRVIDAVAEVTYETAIDGVTLLAAPFLGSVITVNRPLVFYRIHHSNRSMSAKPERFDEEAQRFINRLEHLSRIIESAKIIKEIDWKKNSFYVDRRALAEVARTGRMTFFSMVRYWYFMISRSCYTRRYPLLIWSTISCFGPTWIRTAAFDRRVNPWSELKEFRKFLRYFFSKRI